MNSHRATDRPQPVPTGHIDEALAVLRRLPVFKHISLEMIKLCAYLSSRETYRQGETILRQGTICDGLRLIIQGNVLISHTAEQRTIRLQQLTGEDLNYFGELALISSFRWFFNAQALSDVQLLMISRDSFTKIMERFPETYIDVVSEIVKLRVIQFNNQTDYLINQMGDEGLANLSINFPAGAENV